MPSYLDDLRPASFRGVTFLADHHQRPGGRRVARHEFPLRNRGSAEDLGQRQPSYKLAAYLLGSPGESYFAHRDKLQAAFDAPGPGKLVHPWLGTLIVYCASAVLQEGGDRGNEATWELEFVDSGLGTPGATTLIARPDTGASLISGVKSWVTMATSVYSLAAQIAKNPGVLLGVAESYLGGLATSLTGLSPATVLAIAGSVAALVSSATAGARPVTSRVTGAVGDPVAIAVTDCFFAAADAIATARDPAIVNDPVLGISGVLRGAPADPSGGLAAFATWQPPSAPATSLQAAAQAGLQAQFSALVQGAAVAATAQLFAGVAWPSANAASAASTQLLALFDAQVAATAAAGQDEATGAWLGLTGLAIADLNARVRQLPSLLPYATRASLPAPVLAQMLYQDATRADELFALNGGFHPGFLPPSGMALAA